MEVSAAVATTAAAMSVKSMELKWVSSRGKTQMEKTIKTPSKSKSPFPLQAMVPIFISTNPSHVHPSDLRDLFTACNLSPHRFPNYADDGGVEAVDLHKLRIALSHSSVLVSVFCKPSDLIGDSSSLSSSIETQQQKRKKKKKTVGFGELLQNAVTPVSPSNGQLVGFGRAVSDLGLTASVYDVMVIPSLREMGIGRMIVRRIIRILTSRDIYDIAALCSDDERSFFKGCGFGDDILASTAMMYTRSSISTDPEGNEQMIKRAGRKLLVVPPLLNTLGCKKTRKS
ncbi:unnamed protein product [Malus baccata var. baccata]